MGEKEWTSEQSQRTALTACTEGNAEERDAGEGTVTGSTTLGRPIIAGEDRKTGGAHAHQVKCKGQCDSWIANKNCSRRVVLKVNQEGGNCRHSKTCGCRGIG